MAEEDAPDDDSNDESGGAPSLNLEVARSLLSFIKRALRRRRLLIAGLLVIGGTLTVLLIKYFPRTYNCSTTLMTVQNAVLDSDRGPQPLAGAEGLLMSRDHLEQLIKETDLKKTYYARRPPLMALKDKLLRSAFGPMDDKVLTAVLVGTLETKLTITIEKDQLTISVDWADAKTAAELALASQQDFLRMRHNAEISAFHEKMAILDRHAGELREEVEKLAAQIKEDLKAKAVERAAEAKERLSDAPRSALAPRRFLATRALSDDELPSIRERLAALKQKLNAVESERTARIREEQTKLDELKLRLTPSHPQVMTQQERVGIAAQVPSELALMRSEVEDLESQVRQREAMARTSRPAGVSAAGDEPMSQALPSDILQLLDQKDVDPALSAQMSGAVVRYGSLRDDVRGAKLALDTAQAAFNHRYQVIIPVEEPDRPTKPKVAVLFGTGLALSLLLAFALPILMELKRDVVVESWQVHQYRLPVLGELRLPQRSNDQSAGPTS